MPASVAIGIDSFLDFRRNNYEYVDKTRLIRDVIDDAISVILLPRPRRFGKTLNMTMLEAFFARREEDFRSLFDGLFIARAGAAYWQHFQRYPTLFISFKNLKATSLAEWRAELNQELAKLMETWAPVLTDSGKLNHREIALLNMHLNGTAEESEQRHSLLLLSEWLHRIYGERVLILIDEYDSPILEAWAGGHQRLRDPHLRPELANEPPLACYEKVIRFFRTFFGAALKGNPHLYKAVLTGIFRISRESLFSELNNVDVYTLLQSRYSNAFGFTEQETLDLFTRQQQLERLPEARTWYNGYRFGPHTIYNPWSVTKFLKNPDDGPAPYWANTSSNELLKEQLVRFAPLLQEELQAILRGASIVQPLKSDMVMTSLENSSDALFTLLVFAGYLKAEWVSLEEGASMYQLSIPNLEVKLVYRELFRGWIESNLGVGFSGNRVHQLAQAIVSGQVRPFQHFLSTFALNMLSFHDGLASQPEALYQGLMVGLCAVLEPTWLVRSNRETWFGRADLQLIPKDRAKPGAVLELKVAEPPAETLEQAIKEGLAQLKERHYVAELQALGVPTIHQWVLAFDGKTVKVAYAGVAPAPAALG